MNRHPFTHGWRFIYPFQLNHKYIRKIYSLLMGCLLASSSLFSQETPGCTDPAAANYNPSANLNNGTCLYPGCTNPIRQLRPASQSGQWLVHHFGLYGSGSCEL